MLCSAGMNGYLRHGVSQVTGIVPVDERTKSKIGGIVDISSLQKKVRPRLRCRALKDVGRAIYEVDPLRESAGTGTTPAGGSSHGSLAACALATCELVASAVGFPTRPIAVTVQRRHGPARHLGLSREVPVDFQAIRVQFDPDIPDAALDQLRARGEDATIPEVLETLWHPPKINSRWSTASR